MQRALELAGRGRYSVSPNPMVGCVIVRNDRVIGEGFHLRAGLPHAEIEALRSCNESVAGATIYVTLEPCAHTGRTPPCVDALIEARPSRVVVAIEDPFPEVAGRGIAKLRDAGIEVTTGVSAERAERLNERFLHACRSSLPFVVLKAGMTLDGKLATVTRQSKWITSEAAREESLRLREECDAILVGSGTVLADDPQLTRRLGLSSSVTPWRRVLLDADRSLRPELRVFDGAAETLVYTTGAREPLPNAETVALPARGGFLDVRDVLRDLYERGVRSVVAEGGSSVHSQLIRERLWQKMVVFVAPILVGGAAAPSIFSGEGVPELTSAFRLRFDSAKSVGPDLMITAYPPERN